MSTLKQRFAELSALRPDISQADLARATGAKPPSVHAWFSGLTKSMKASTASKAAGLYGVNSHWLATGEGEMLAGVTAANIKFSLDEQEQAPIVQSLKALDTHLAALAPVFKDSAREVLRKWALGLASQEDAADALQAMALATESMPKK